jgi:hypothetical protein
MSRRTPWLLFAACWTLSGAAWAHQGHLSDVAWRACDGESLGAACDFEDSSHAIYRGTCRSMSDDLVCVRNRPIERPDEGVPPASAALGAGLVLLWLGAMWSRR